VKDLSDLAKDSIGVDTGSMAATNTISVVPRFGAPGSVSESTHSVAPSDPAISINLLSAQVASPVEDNHSERVSDKPFTQPRPAWKTVT
jgi:hypothetical protein